MFRFGMADWSAFATQEIEGRKDTRLNLSLGAMIAGGEATASLNYNTYDPFSEKQQYYLWRYVDNDFSIFRQAMIGKIAVQSTSSLFNPVVGVQFTNTPTTYRRSFGSYILSERTEPGWVVELYVNNVLVDYIKADASGFFQFEVPLVYGNSIIQMKFYGPWGEERVREQNINIPFNFIPEKTFEYRVSAGFVEDTSFSRFSKISLNYGVSRRLTVGGGVEYLSSVVSRPAMPYVNASWSLFNNVLLSGEYTHGVRSKGTLSYRMLSNVQLDLNYTKYVSGQKAIMYNYLEERKATLSVPLKIKSFSSYNRFSVYQIVLPLTGYINGEPARSTTNYTTGEWMFSGSFLGINTNLTTYALFIGDTDPYVYSNLSFGLRLPGNITFMPQAQYGYSRKEFISTKLIVEKRIREKAFLNFSYEHNFNNNLNMAEFGFRFNFDFAQTGFSVRQSNNKTSFIEYARGSLIYDKKTKYLGAYNQFNVGKGCISVIPYLDLNANGLRDSGEPKAYGLNLRANGGRVEKSEKDTTILIVGLEPYTNCFIDLDANSFENISWRMPVQVLSVSVDPEIVKHIEIPVTVVGEASGTVILEKKGEPAGLGRIIVSFFTKDYKLVGSTLTEDDGYFSWFGFNPGQYRVAIDTSQMRKLAMISEPGSMDFNITGGREGDFVDGLDFRLKLIESDTIVAVIQPVQKVITKDTSVLTIHEIFEELTTITKDSYAIQLGAFRNRGLAENFRRNLEKTTGRKMEIVAGDDGFFKVRITNIPERSEADEIISDLHKNGISVLWIVIQKVKEQQVAIVERERRDTVVQIFEPKTFLPFSDYKLDTPSTPLMEQTVVKAIERQLPKLEYKDIAPIIRITREEPLIPAVVGVAEAVERTEVKLDKLDVSFGIPDLSTPLSKMMTLESAPAIPDIPEISLQVGIFYKRSEALKARRKIVSKLNLPVQIIEQWEYFRVIIIGFSSREETFQYYPELAGLGYPNITLIEE